MESARQAIGPDISDILAVAAEVDHELNPHRGGKTFFAREGHPGSDPGTLKQSLADDEIVFVVGEFCDVVFGYGVARVEELADGSQIGRLDALAVVHDARGVGLGEAMMNLILDSLRSVGCVSVDAQALPGDRHTKNFFESFGLKARLLTVNKLL